MTTLERIAVQLKATGLYKMNGTSLVEAEILAYANALDDVAVIINDAMNNCFLDEMTSTAYDYFERLFCLPYSYRISTEPGRSERIKKIAMMKKRLSIRNNDFNKVGLKKAMSSGGLEVDFSENFATATTTVTVKTDAGYFATPAERVDFIKKMMPCSATIMTV